MKQFVLLSKRTANLLLGCRVCFIDQENVDTNIPFGPKSVFSIGVLDCHGWVVFHSEGTGGFWLFMNTGWVEKEFTVLGEL